MHFNCRLELQQAPPCTSDAKASDIIKWLATISFDFDFTILTISLGSYYSLFFSSYLAVPLLVRFASFSDPLLSVRKYFLENQSVSEAMGLFILSSNAVLSIHSDRWSHCKVLYVSCII